MTLADLTQSVGQWLRGEGLLKDVVISSRVRLARNLADTPFLPRCPPEQTRQLEQRLRDVILAAGLAQQVFYIDISAASPLDRRLLVERHLMSKPHAQDRHPRGLAISANEALAIMTIEEDHLRIQVLSGGMDLKELTRQIQRVDELLEERLSFAFHQQYGYLTACPTNVGTGMRVSCMLHLPALKMTGEIERALRAARELRVAVRGLFGEDTQASGDFFQVSNQLTLGKSESQIVEEFSNRTVPLFVQYERRAREVLLDKHRSSLEDKIFRAQAILRSAKLLHPEETMYLLSMIRLGINLAIIKDVELKTVNELFLLTQPAHLQKLLNKRMGSVKQAEARAEYIRKRMGAIA